MNGAARQNITLTRWLTFLMFMMFAALEIPVTGRGSA